jgi:hypothetical protein
MFSVAVPLLETTKECVNSVPSKTVGKVCIVCLKWIIGPTSGGAEYDRLP